MKKWKIKKNDGNIEKMSEKMGVSKELSQILLNRGINTPNLVNNFLGCDYDNFGDFTVAKDVVKSIEFIKPIIIEKKPIVIYGDYDVDGVMSTCILYKSLLMLGANVSYYIPNRESEGYGLNKSAIDKINKTNTYLIITCDNGIASLEENRYIKELGMNLIVIDHHEPPILNIVDNNESSDYLVPVADYIIDPKQSDCTYSFKQMCAAGLCYRFACELFKSMDKKNIIHDELVVFAMIATFCDIVELQSDNRIIVKKGLQVINANKDINKGLKELILIKSIDKNIITSYHVGFIIGPCINATGRLERATLSVELFTNNNDEECSDLALRLYDLNEERKAFTKAAQEETMLMLTNSDIINQKIFVIYNNSVHESIAGIVAGRIKDTFYHPTIVITNAENGLKGSARSIEGYNIFEELTKCQKYFDRFGGHSMAAGLSMQENLLEDFRNELNENCTLTENDFCETIAIDDELNLADVSYKLAEEMGKLKPFGKGNREPLFVSYKVKVVELKMIEDKNTIIFNFGNNDGYKYLKGICFGMVDQFKEQVQQQYSEYVCDKIFAGIIRNVDLIMDIVYYIDINEYNNNVSVQLKLKDFKVN